MQSLNEQISAAVSMGFIPIDVPNEIKSNLNPKLTLRQYQQEAFSRFVYYSTNYPQRLKPTQLLFHMATGSGKTLVMAGCILHLYELGYRNFIFFVNSSSIIEKTKDNFLNKCSSKYLFNSNISLKGQNIEIKEVENFEAVNESNINIVFTTIQGLHTRLNTPRENGITYEDFEDKKIVLLSDEAHHINAETKKEKLSRDEAKDIITWEGTVTKIFNANPDNYLLEFTATADLAHPEVKTKYYNKLIFDYPLRQFKNDGYSKEVKILQADLPPFERAVQAVIISQYRKKVFENHGKQIKPVLLLKSKTISESQSFITEFIDGIKNLNAEKVKRVFHSNSGTVVATAFNYFKAQGVTLENLILELREDFSANKCISVNSKNDSEEKQLIINSLEEENNEYRVVFAVDKLNEGWDVLNLFDIVRLYDTRDADTKTGKAGKTTMSEAQLIGRGARYCPFKITDDQPLYQRKYDKDIENDLRIGEELYYHASYNPRYISELNKALEEIGLKSGRSVERKLSLKESFKRTSFYKSGVVYVNKQVPNEREDVFALDKRIREKLYTYHLLTGYTIESAAFGNLLQMQAQKDQRTLCLHSFGQPIIRKAINRLPFYYFSNLKRYFPHLKSITEFIDSNNYLKPVHVLIEGATNQLDNLSPLDKLNVAVKVLDEISKAVQSGSVEVKGSREFTPRSISYIFKDKTLNIAVNENGDQEFGVSQVGTLNPSLYLDLSTQDWYVFNDNFGTSEEKYLVRYIHQAYSSLKAKYENVYLIRNEKHFKIFAFSDGRAVEPDFVLFLENKKGNKSVVYQIFIEPKGQHLIATDKWKEDFLKEIEEEYKLETVFENKDFKLIGMPFYNETLKRKEFDNRLKEIVTFSDV